MARRKPRKKAENATVRLAQSGVPPALPGRPSKFDSSGNARLPLVSRSKHHEREHFVELQEATTQRMGV
jgi:hypothetical protein